MKLELTQEHNLAVSAELHPEMLGILFAEMSAHEQVEFLVAAAKRAREFGDHGWGRQSLFLTRAARYGGYTDDIWWMVDTLHSFLRDAQQDCPLEEKKTP